MVSLSQYSARWQPKRPQLQSTMIREVVEEEDEEYYEENSDY